MAGRMAQTADFLILGGGMAGVSAAALLAQEARVHLIEAEDQLGFHSTGRSAAMYVPNYGPPLIRHMVRLSGAVFRDYKQIAPTPLLSPRGEMVIAREGEGDILNDAISSSDGMEALSIDDALDIVPILDRGRIVAACYDAAAADIDIDAVFQGYIRMLRGGDGHITTGHRSQAINRVGGAWRVESQTGDIFEAPVLINAAGAWVDIVAGLAGIKPCGIQPKRRSAVLIPPPDGHDISAWPLTVSASEDWYCRPNGGKLMVSPADEDPVPPKDAWPDDMVLAEGIDRFEKDTTAVVSRVDYRWAGLRSFAPDGNPVIGFDPSAEGFFWLGGQGGYGIETAPANARLTADLCLGRDCQPDAETLAALSPARYR